MLYYLSLLKLRSQLLGSFFVLFSWESTILMKYFNIISFFINKLHNQGIFLNFYAIIFIVTTIFHIYMSKFMFISFDKCLNYSSPPLFSKTY